MIRIASFPMLYQIKKKAEDVREVTSMIAFYGVIGALAYKIAGFVLSLLTAGKLTFLGTIMVSSPFFYIPLGLLIATAGISFLVEKAVSQVLHPEII